MFFSEQHLRVGGVNPCRRATNSTSNCGLVSYLNYTLTLFVDLPLEYQFSPPSTLASFFTCLCYYFLVSDPLSLSIQLLHVLLSSFKTFKFPLPLQKCCSVDIFIPIHRFQANQRKVYHKSFFILYLLNRCIYFYICIFYQNDELCVDPTVICTFFLFVNFDYLFQVFLKLFMLEGQFAT